MFGWRHISRQVFRLFIDPFFIALTIIGNSFIILNALVFYFIEHEENQMVNGVFDAIWWAFTTVTTVGYGDITPVTTLGRVHGILLMLAGTAIFLSYTALFAKALLGHDIEEVEQEVKHLEKALKDLGETQKSKS
ncbi:MAG: two pore domain potassium channel family protein [Deltaproteobacteria bacterium]|nr:two pore domain potassium channel family protein [Deltaproteobacteria bacterium]